MTDKTSKKKLLSDFGDLKGLLDNGGPAKPSSPKSNFVKSSHTDATVANDAGILHSYIRNIINGSEVYDMMKDTEVDGASFLSLAESQDDEMSKDIVEYFACCFFEGEYSALDTIAVQCDEGNERCPAEHASILGHTVALTYSQEFRLLAELYSVALKIDSRMDSKQEEVRFYYVPDKEVKVTDNADKDNAPVLRYRDTPKVDLSDVRKTRATVIPKKKTAPVPVKENEPSKDFKPKPRVRHSIASSPSMKRKSFSSHIANTGVWGRIADYGGYNGPLIHINAGHGR